VFGGRASLGSMGKAPDGGLGPHPQKLMTLFVKICYFVTVLRIAAIFHSLLTSLQYEMEKFNLGAEKMVPQATMFAHWAQKVEGRLPALLCPVGSAASDQQCCQNINNLLIC